MNELKVIDFHGREAAPPSKSVIYGVMDNDWARGITEMLSGICERDKGIKFTKMVLTPKDPAQCRMPTVPVISDPDAIAVFKRKCEKLCGTKQQCLAR